MKIVVSAFSAVALLLMFGCTARKSAAGKGLKQGIEGFVREVSGNQMPSPQEPAPSGRPLKTTVYIYEPTHLNQVERIGTSSFYRKIRTNLVMAVETDENGFFSTMLPEGDYSLFTKIKGEFYSNLFDRYNNIFPVSIRQDSLVRVNITISAGASY
jgi:hypothetical protein